MSIHVISWVLQHSEEPLGRRLVLIVLADHAQSDGTEAWPTVDTIAREARLSRRQVQRCLRELEKSGSIAKTGERDSGIGVWRVLMGGVEMSREGGVVLSAEGRHPVPEGGGDLSPEPSFVLEPSLNRPKNAPARPENRPLEVDGKAVTDAEYNLAAAVLAAFNAAAGSRYSGQEQIRRIIMRLREQPDLDLAAHEEIIRAVFARPWWKGNPDPRVIYGNASIFERSLHAVDAASAGISAEDMGTYGTAWGPGTPYDSPQAARAAKRDAVEVEAEEVDSGG